MDELVAVEKLDALEDLRLSKIGIENA